MRALNLTLFVLGLVLIVCSVELAEHAYEWGGYLQRGLVHATTAIGALVSFTAGRHLLRG